MKIKKFIFGLIFNIAETILIFMIGKMLQLQTSYIILIMTVFFISRMIYGQPKHYNKWYRCCVWSSLVFTSLFVLSNLDLFAIILLTVFTALISSGKADITDIYMWKNGSKYQDIVNYIKYNEFSDDLITFEDKLKKKDNLIYLVYRYRFKDGKTFSQISSLLDIETNRLTEILDKVAFAIRIYCKI